MTSTGNGQNVDSYSIASNRALKFAQRTQVNASGGGAITLLLDHTGSSLYVGYYDGLNNNCLSYSVDQSTGAITYLSNTGGGLCPVSFIGNNEFAYASSCVQFNPSLDGWKRNSDGTLSFLGIHPALPTPPPGTTFCPNTAAGDPSN